MEFDREYWEGMTRGALYEHIIKLEAKVEGWKAQDAEGNRLLARLTAEWQLELKYRLKAEARIAERGTEMSDVYYYGNQPMLKYKSGKKFGAVPIDKAAADLIESLQAEVERYRKAIKKWLDGDYPNPRAYRPQDCPHGTHYWESCENCETEYWQSVAEPTEKDDG